MLQISVSIPIYFRKKRSKNIQTIAIEDGYVDDVGDADIAARNYKSRWLITSPLGQMLAAKEVHRLGQKPVVRRPLIFVPLHGS